MDDEKNFLEKYGFTNFQTVTVANPTKEDHEFQMMIDVGVDRATGKMRAETRKFVVKAGSSERFPGVVAGMYLEQMAKKIAQGTKAGLNSFVNFHTRAALYDDLIIEVDDLLDKQYQAFDDNMGGSPVAADKPETTFAGARKQDAAK